MFYGGKLYGPFQVALVGRKVEMQCQGSTQRFSTNSLGVGTNGSSLRWVQTS